MRLGYNPWLAGNTRVTGCVDCVAEKTRTVFSATIPSRDVVCARRFDAVAASIMHRLDRMESAAATSDYVLHEVLSERLVALGRTLGIQDAAV